MPIYHKGEIVWYEAREIVYDIHTVMFVLDHLNTFEDGRYPPRPSTGYTGESQHAMNPRAPFVTAAEIYAELTRRINVCFPDCFLVYEKYGNGYSVERIAAIHKQNPKDVQRRIERVIGYTASGHAPRWTTTEKRKGVEYREWCRKGRLPITKQGDQYVGKCPRP